MYTGLPHKKYVFWDAFQGTWSSLRSSDMFSSSPRALVEYNAFLANWFITFWNCYLWVLFSKHSHLCQDIWISIYLFYFRGGQLTSLGVGKGDLVIISLENKTMIALGIGTITDINSRHIKVLLDRYVQVSIILAQLQIRGGGGGGGGGFKAFDNTSPYLNMLTSILCKTNR